MEKIGAALYAIATIASYYGLGSAFYALTEKRKNRDIGLALGTGMSIFVIAASMLGALGSLSSTSINALTFLGVLAALIDAIQAKPQGATKKILNRSNLPTAAAIITILAITVQTQLPVSIYNFHDDLQKYLSHPIRILETGSTTGSPLSALGWETLGGQALLQTGLVGNFGTIYTGSFDAVIGLISCALIIGTSSPLSRKHDPIARTAGIILLIAINPQIVNSASVYTGAALVSCCILVSTSTKEESRRNTPMSTGESLTLPILYAGLISLKTTYILFVAIHFAIHNLMQWRTQHRLRHSFLISLSTFFCTLAALSPLAIAHRANILHTLKRQIDATHIDGVALISQPRLAPGNGNSYPYILSADSLFYGGSALAYTLSASIPLIISLFLYFKEKDKSRRGEDNLNLEAIISLTSMAFCGLATYLLLFSFTPQLLNGSQAGLRYAVPTIIGTTPTTIAIAIELLRSSNDPDRRTIQRIILASTILVFTAFFNSLTSRTARLFRLNTQLAFAAFADTQNYRRYNTLSFNPTMRSRIRKIQQLTQPGTRIIAWSNHPFFLDFKRNTIIEVDPAGLSSPWARIPKADYLILDYAGFATRTRAQVLSQAIFAQGNNERRIGTRILELQDALSKDIARGLTIYRDSQTIAIKLR